MINGKLYFGTKRVDFYNTIHHPTVNTSTNFFQDNCFCPLHCDTHTHWKSTWQLYADTNTGMEKSAMGDEMQSIKIRTLKATRMACRKFQDNIKNVS
jgi:hypothetical protein